MHDQRCVYCEHMQSCQPGAIQVRCSNCKFHFRTDRKYHPRVAVPLKLLARDPRLCQKVAQSELELDLNRQRFCRKLPASFLHNYISLPKASLALIGRYVIVYTGKHPKPYRQYAFRDALEAFQVFAAIGGRRLLLPPPHELDRMSRRAASQFLVAQAQANPPNPVEQSVAC